MTRRAGRRTVEKGHHLAPEGQDEDAMSVAMLIDNTDAAQEFYEALRSKQPQCRSTLVSRQLRRRAQIWIGEDHDSQR